MRTWNRTLARGAWTVFGGANGVVAEMRTVSLRAGTGPEFYLTSVQGLTRR